MTVRAMESMTTAELKARLAKLQIMKKACEMRGYEVARQNAVLDIRTALEVLRGAN